MTSWEYARIQVSTSSISSVDNQVAQLGADGWELVSVVEAANSYLHFWFKRPAGGGR